MDRDLGQDEFRRYHDLIHQLTGIHYPADKIQLLGNRLRKRMRPLGMDDYGAYLTHIQQRDQRVELQQFVDSITTNETYFFRCKRHWDLFADWVRTTAGSSRTLRIWSAAASNGSEAYTILIVLDQILGRGFGGRTVEVLGTDLNLAVLQEAKTGIYRPYALSQTPADVIQGYFQRVDNDRYQVDRRLLRHVTFRQHNLMEAMVAPPFDFVFLRNVMIYFDKPSKERVLAHMHRALRPGGMLMVGESESLLNVGHPFAYLRPSWFQKAESVPTPTPPRDPAPTRR